jgi:hypothetical protein
VKRPHERQLNNIPIYRADGGAIIGIIAGDVLRKEGRASKHMLRRPPSWAAAVEALDAAKAAGAQWVEYHDLDSGAVYRAALSEFYRVGLSIDRGAGPQLALPLRYWTVTRPGAPVAGAGQAQAAAGPSQLRLF